MTDGLLAGKTAIVSGAGRGIGLAIARGLLGAGADVIGIGRNPLPDIGFSHTIQVDLGETDAAERIGARLRDLGIAPDVLINNAALSDKRPLDAVTAEQWLTLMAVNLRAPHLLIREIAPLMTGGGSIINISSIRGLRGFEGDSVYQAAKGGIEMLTKALAVELAPRGIRVNAIAPGAILTDFNSAALADAGHRDAALDMIPLGRFGEPGDVVGAAVYLAGSLSGFVTGTTLVVDGGQSIRG